MHNIDHIGDRVKHQFMVNVSNQKHLLVLFLTKKGRKFVVKLFSREKWGKMVDRLKFKRTAYCEPYVAFIFQERLFQHIFLLFDVLHLYNK